MMILNRCATVVKTANKNVFGIFDMPIYVYRCPECGREEERFRKMAQANNHATCPKCGIKMARMVGAANFRFKGEGFPTNDFKKQK